MYPALLTSLIRARTTAVTLACGVLVSCPAEPESGVGQGPTGEGFEMLPSSSGPTDADSGLDESGGGPAVVPPPVAKSYFIAESMDFTGNGCEEKDVNEVTDSFKEELDDDGWAGTRVTEGQTQPADFIDSVLRPFGRDHLASDAVSLAVFAGHGWMNKLAWGISDTTPGIPPDDRCQAEFSEDIRLGSASGRWAKAVALLTSCTGRLACYQNTLATNDITQVFAFNNSPMIWGNSARRFYRKSGHMSNRSAWIAAMDNRPGFGKNSPVTYTRGTSEAQVLQLHESARLPQIEELPGNQESTWFAYTWVDYGLKNDECSPLHVSCIGVDD